VFARVNRTSTKSNVPVSSTEVSQEISIGGPSLGTASAHRSDKAPKGRRQRQPSSECGRTWASVVKKTKTLAFDLTVMIEHRRPHWTLRAKSHTAPGAYRTG
jgi:hypothetical protein